MRFSATSRARPATKPVKPARAPLDRPRMPIGIFTAIYLVEYSNGNKLVSMTGNPDSALAKNSDVHLDVSVEEEACILHLAPTTSTTAQIAMGDLGQPSDIAHAVAYLASSGAGYVTGQELHVNGGMYM